MTEVEIGRSKRAINGYAFDDIAMFRPEELVTPKMFQPTGVLTLSSSTCR